jgi:predicted  nucleic acid-binding Zn-ribbon protein
VTDAATDLEVPAVSPTPGAAISAAELELLRRELTELRRQLVKGESELARSADLEARLAAAHGALQEHEALQARFADLQGDYESLRLAHEQTVNSSSWRLTAPLRRLNSVLSSRS